MKKFNYSNKIFSVNGTVSDKIIIFDIDDTLIHSNATVNIIKDNKVVREIDSSTFNTYILNDGEMFDFSNFDSSSLLDKAATTKYWNTMVSEYNKGTHIAILTARSKPVMIKKFLLKKGIDIKDELIFCTGYSKFLFRGTIAEKKAKVVEFLYMLGYRNFIMYDDNVENLKTVKLLEQFYNDIKINAIKAKI